MKRVEPLQPNFGIRIKKLRFDLDMSQQQLAELCELSVDQIANIERGKNFAGKSTIPLLADALRATQQELFDFSGNDDFVKSGGMKWRASRKQNVLHVRNRKVAVPIPGQRQQ